MDLLLDSLRRRMRAMHSLYEDALVLSREAGDRCTKRTEGNRRGIGDER